MPRQARLDYPGALHHVIGRGIDGAYVFKETRDKQEFLSRLKIILREKSFQIYAWCLMDNHFHLLVQTGKTPLAELMRSWLTGYAIYYNKAHQRKGYLFQNRYKSILCERDEYLLPLIRYIHLNPVKAKIVSLSQLKEYPWTGHKELMNREKESLVDRDEVLGLFAVTEKQSIEVYMDYLKDDQSSNADFMGGGLIRSLGGLEEAAKANPNDKQMYDERILGSGEFVGEVLGRLEAEDNQKKIFKNLDDLLTRAARYYKVEIDDIIQTRAKKVREARNILVFLGNACLGKSVTEMGKFLKIKASAASQANQKGRRIVREKGLLKELSKIRL